jgi:hypothetical protein
MRSGVRSQVPECAPDLLIHIRCRSGLRCREIRNPTSDTHKPEANGLGLWKTRLADDPTCRLVRSHTPDEPSRSGRRASGLPSSQQLQTPGFDRDSDFDPSSLSLALQEALSDEMSSPSPDDGTKQLSLTAGFATPPFAFLRSFTSTQDHEHTAGQEHHGNNCCEIYDKLITQSASCMFLHRTARNCWMLSIFGQPGIPLGPPLLSTVQIAARLDMA